MAIYEKLYFPHKCMASCPHRRFNLNYSLNYRDSHEQPTLLTRMHSSRMRTVRCRSRLLWGGVCLGVSAQGGVGPEVSASGVSAQGVSAQGVSAQGVSAQGCLPKGGIWQTPPVNRMTDACENITLPHLRCGR